MNEQTAPLGTPTLEALEELRRQQELDAETERLEAEQRERAEAEAWERIAAEENAAQAGRVTEEEYEAHREHAQQAAHAEEQEAADPCALALAGIRALGKNPPPHELRAALRAFGEEVVKLNRLDRGIARGEALKLLPRGSAEVVDAVMPKAPPEPEENRLALANVEPWPEPVDGDVLLNDIASAFRRWLVLPKWSTEAIALWSVWTHCIDAFNVSPMLIAKSPTKRCGKSSLLLAVVRLAARGKVTSSITPSALFRIIERDQPTLVFDEFDRLDKKSERYKELHQIINASHYRDTAFTERCVGDDHEPRSFPTFCPKALGSIGAPDDTLLDRSLIVPMARKKRDDKVDRFRRKNVDPVFAELRRRAARWAADHVAALRQAEPELPEDLDDRAQDNWEPLLAIADAVGGKWPKLARASALAISGGEAEEQDTATLLLEDLRDLFATRGVDRLPTEAILEHLNALEERPWPSWGRGSGLNPRHLASLLRGFDDPRPGPGGQRRKVERTTFKIGAKAHKGYELAALADAFARYIPARPENDTSCGNHGNHSESTTEISENESVTEGQSYRSQNRENASDNSAVTVVTAEKPNPGAGGEKMAPKRGRGGVL